MSKFKKYEINLRKKNRQEDTNAIGEQKNQPTRYVESDTANNSNQNSPSNRNENLSPPTMTDQPKTESTPITYDAPKQENEKLLNPQVSQNNPSTPTNPQNANTQQTDNPQFSFMEDPNNKKGGRWIFLFSILIGILLIAAGYTVFRYFKTLPSDAPRQTSDVADVERNNQESPGDLFSGIIPQMISDYEGIVTGSSEVRESDQNNKTALNSQEPIPAPTVSPSPTPTPTEVSQSQTSNQAYPAVSQQQDSVGISAKWVANNYNKGDITTNSYTVVSGDTLWELAEGYYGNGNDWVKIAQANNVKNLPNGHPLIIPGQVLTFP